MISLPNHLTRETTPDITDDVEMIRKILKAIGWIVTVVAGLGIAIYLIALAINWSDQDPSAAAVELANLYRDRPRITDEDNGFIYVMGFAVAVGDDPYQMGLKRVAWLQKSNPLVPLDPAQDPLTERFDYKAKRTPAVRDFIDACKPGSSTCTVAFNAGDMVFEQWAASEDWLLQRYRQLIGHRGWRESVPFDVAAPLPSYSLVMHGQKLLLLNARALAKRGECEHVRDLLEADLSFWRKVLESSDTLITKMIATVAITRNFEMGNLVLREVQPKEIMSAVPTGWSTPISESERAMRRVLAGEWMFMSAALRKTDADLYVLNDESVIAWTLRHLLMPLYQRQDSINRNAAYLVEMNQLLSAPLDRYESAVNRTAELAERTRRESLPPRSLYNVAGRVLIGIGAYDFGTYARRFADLEGVRRAALLSVTLRAENVRATELNAALSASALREPYHNRPFESDANAGAVVFRGLTIGERSVHRIYY